MDETECETQTDAERMFVRATQLIANLARDIATSQDLSGVSGKDVLLLFARTIEGGRTALLREFLEGENFDAGRRGA